MAPPSDNFSQTVTTSNTAKNVGKRTVILADAMEDSGNTVSNVGADKINTATSDVTLSDSVEGATATPHHNIQGQYHGLEPRVRADNSDIAVTTTTSNINEQQHLLVSRENQQVNSALSKICYGRRGIQNQPSTVSNVGIPMAASPSNVVQPAVVVTSQYSTTVGSAQPVYGNVPDFRATVSTQQVAGNDSRPTAPTVIGRYIIRLHNPPNRL